MTDSKSRLGQTESGFEHSMCKKPSEKNQPLIKPKAESSVNEEEYRYSSGFRTQADRFHGYPQHEGTYQLRETEHDAQMNGRDSAPYFSLRTFPI